jgi:hypothetical protein
MEGKNRWDVGVVRIWGLKNAVGIFILGGAGLFDLSEARRFRLGGRSETLRPVGRMRRGRVAIFSFLP